MSDRSKLADSSVCVESASPLPLFKGEPMAHPALFSRPPDLEPLKNYVYPSLKKDLDSPLEESKQAATNTEEETITTGPSNTITGIGYKVASSDELHEEPTEELTFNDPVTDECCGKDDNQTVWEDTSTIDGFSEAECYF